MASVNKLVKLPPLQQAVFFSVAQKMKTKKFLRFFTNVLIFASVCLSESLAESESSPDAEDTNECLLYTRKNFTGPAPTLSLTPTVKVFDTSLLFETDSSKNGSSTKGIVLQSVALAPNCSVILCNGKHLEGDCLQLSTSKSDISGEREDEVVYKNVKSVDCHCSSINSEDIVKISSSPKNDTDPEISGYSGKLQSTSGSSSCATLFRDWHHKGHPFSLDFAGSAGKIGVDRVRSITVREGCTVTLWSEFRTFSVGSSVSFLQTNNNSVNYEWACCSCDQCSKSVCEQAYASSRTLSFSSPPFNQDFSQFVKYGKKIIGIGRNYRWTKVELAKVLSVPKEPIVFLKPSTSYLEEGQVIELPKSLGTIFYELELGVVIGKGGKDIAEGQALEHVAGYFLALDMTAKEFIKRSGNQSLPWEIGKGFDTACPVGKFIPKSQLEDPNNIHLECRVNGEVTQSETTANMIFNVQQLIAYVSRYMTLEPYDTILTGTPDGFGPLKEGDVVTGRLGNLTSIQFTAKLS